jgi:3-hydroxyacyl-[acyl-carrier-protein] dehydratase
MLITDFYTLQKTEITVDKISADILLNPNHEVYKGHFPGQPVVPGVIQLQIVKEILEEILGQQLFMDNVSSAKYLRIITPDAFPELKVTIQYSKTAENEIKVNALIGSPETIFTKLKMKLRWP